MVVISITIFENRENWFSTELANNIFWIIETYTAEISRIFTLIWIDLKFTVGKTPLVIYRLHVKDVKNDMSPISSCHRALLF